MSLDQVRHAVDACYPAQGQEVFTRLRHASVFRDTVDLQERPVQAAGTVLQAAAFQVEARPLSHTIPALGYRLSEADGRRMLPDRLAAFGITGPDIGRLQREGSLVTGERLVTLDQVSEPRRGQRFAFIMDTRLCDAAFELAEGADRRGCSCSPISRNATSTPTRRGSPRKRRQRSAARWYLPMTLTGSRYHPGDPQPPNRSAAEADVPAGTFHAIARGVPTGTLTVTTWSPSTDGNRCG